MLWRHKPHLLRETPKDGGQGAGAGNSKPEDQKDQSGNSQTEGENSGQSPESAEGQKPEAKYSQTDLDKIAGQSRKEGRKSAEGDLLKQLGVKTLDEAKAALDAAAKLRQSQMTEAERLEQARQDAEARAAQAEQARQDAEARALATRIESEIIANAAGRFANPSAVVRLIDRSAIAVEGDTVTGVAEALEKLAKSDPWTLLPEGKRIPAIGRTNSGGKPQARTDADRKRDYFGQGGPGFFKGGGVAQVTNVEEPETLE